MTSFSHWYSKSIKEAHEHHAKVDAENKKQAELQTIRDNVMDSGFEPVEIDLSKNIDTCNWDAI